MSWFSLVDMQLCNHTLLENFKRLSAVFKMATTVRDLFCQNQDSVLWNNAFIFTLYLMLRMSISVISIGPHLRFCLLQDENVGHIM